MFSPKPDIGRTYGRTDISNYRVALLLKTIKFYFLKKGIKWTIFELDPFYTYATIQRNFCFIFVLALILINNFQNIGE